MPWVWETVFPSDSTKPSGQFPVVRAAQLSAVPMVHHRNMASILARTRADAVNVAGTAVCDLLAGRQQHDLILDEVEAPWRSAPAHDQVRDLLNGAFKC
jgi:hypothetical protein